MATLLARCTVTRHPYSHVRVGIVCSSQPPCSTPPLSSSCTAAKRRYIQLFMYRLDLLLPASLNNLLPVPLPVSAFHCCAAAVRCWLVSLMMPPARPCWGCLMRRQTTLMWSQSEWGQHSKGDRRQPGSSQASSREGSTKCRQCDNIDVERE